MHFCVTVLFVRNFNRINGRNTHRNNVFGGNKQKKYRSYISLVEKLN